MRLYCGTARTRIRAGSRARCTQSGMGRNVCGRCNAGTVAIGRVEATQSAVCIPLWLKERSGDTTAFEPQDEPPKLLYSRSRRHTLLCHTHHDPFSALPRPPRASHCGLRGDPVSTRPLWTPDHVGSPYLQRGMSPPEGRFPRRRGGRKYAFLRFRHSGTSSVKRRTTSTYYTQLKCSEQSVKLLEGVRIRLNGN